MRLTMKLQSDKRAVPQKQNLYNYANYLIRQEHITFKTLTKEYDLAKQN